MSFKSFNLSEQMINALNQINFNKPTEVQAKVIPLAIKGKKIICQSQTGTGKTHSFLIPIFEQINPKDQSVQALILAPTRELAEQIYSRAVELRNLYNQEITIKRFIGGSDRLRNIEKLSSQPQIVIGTVGRLKDLFVSESALRLDTAKMVVIDEADMTMEIGFLEEIDQMIARMDHEVQIMVFSATIPEKLRPFLRKYLENVTTIEIQKQNVTSSNIKHVLIKSKNKTKEETLVELLRMLNPYLSLVFSNTREKTVEIHKLLNENNLIAAQIHGDLESRERKRIIKSIHDLKYQYIAATDIAARGIDIEGVSHVISIELPKDISFYIHRSGRTGRNNLTGESYIIYDNNDTKYLSKLESLGIDFEHVEIRNGEFKELPKFLNRQKHKFVMSEEEKVARSKVKKSNKVKPGYKKKYESEVKSVTRNLKRANSKKKK